MCVLRQWIRLYGKCMRKTLELILLAKFVTVSNPIHSLFTCMMHAKFEDNTSDTQQSRWMNPWIIHYVAISASSISYKAHVLTRIKYLSLKIKFYVFYSIVIHCLGEQAYKQTSFHKTTNSMSAIGSCHLFMWFLHT